MCALPKSDDFCFADRVAGEHEGAKRPPRVEWMPQKWLEIAILSILKNSKCGGFLCQKAEGLFDIKITSWVGFPRGDLLCAMCLNVTTNWDLSYS